MSKAENVLSTMRLIKECEGLDAPALAMLIGTGEGAVYGNLRTLRNAGFDIEFKEGYRIENPIAPQTPSYISRIKKVYSILRQFSGDKEVERYLSDMEKSCPSIHRLPLTISKQTKKHGGVMRIGHMSQPTVMNPITTTSSITTNFMSLVFSRQVRVSRLGKKTLNLAAHITSSPDGLCWTVILRRDVYFHDGHELTTKDVEYTYNAIREYGKSSMPPGIIERFKIMSPTTYRVFLKRPAPPQYLLRLNRSIAPEHLSGPDNMAQYIGSGPFMVDEWYRSRITFKRNDHYFHEGLPLLDKLVFKYFESAAKAVEAVDSREIDLLIDAPMLTAHDTINTRVFAVPNGTYYALFMDTKTGVFRSKPARQAVRLALDTARIIEHDGPHGKPLSGPFMPDSFAYNPDVLPTSPSPDGAKGLFQSVRSGTSHIRMAVVNMPPNMPRLAASVKTRLAKLGIKTEIVMVEDLSEVGEYDAVLARVGTGSDPGGEAARWCTDGNKNLCQYSNSIVDECFEKANSLMAQSERMPLFHTIHMQIQQDCPAVFLLTGYNQILSRFEFDHQVPPLFNFFKDMESWSVVPS